MLCNGTTKINGLLLFMFVAPDLSINVSKGEESVIGSVPVINSTVSLNAEPGNATKRFRTPLSSKLMVSAGSRLPGVAVSYPDYLSPW